MQFLERDLNSSFGESLILHLLDEFKKVSEPEFCSLKTGIGRPLPAVDLSQNSREIFNFVLCKIFLEFRKTRN